MGEAARWFRQAQDDLRAARDSRASGHHEWACFQAQQAATKALKAVLYRAGRTGVLTHPVKELADLAAREGLVPAGSAGDAKALDMVYIPSRYPNGIAGEETPAEYFDREDADRCISIAESILETARRSIGA